MDNSIDRLRRYLREEITRLESEAHDMRRRADVASFEDLKSGLLQRADDLADEADRMIRLLNQLPDDAEIR